eukprot:TRINITY_DN66822_c0_g1_i1.p1 TRINITY_DN66822_c0_g1~~TRINITY_DN66822_c0_g1_i1.p1  ORF type:complete len:336 (+),score=37.62 TRINITY_DN66822_c0_g1_i1:27-1010(+)
MTSRDHKTFVRLLAVCLATLAVSFAALAFTSHGQLVELLKPPHVLRWRRLSTAGEELAPIRAAVAVLVTDEDWKRLAAEVGAFDAGANAGRYPFVVFAAWPCPLEARQQIERAVRPGIEVIFAHITQPTLEHPSTRSLKSTPSANSSSPAPPSRAELSRLLLRWWSGPFVRHPALMPYEWLWRIEGALPRDCRVPADPLEVLVRSGKFRHGTVLVSAAFQPQPNTSSVSNTTTTPTKCRIAAEVVSLQLLRSTDFAVAFEKMDNTTALYSSHTPLLSTPALSSLLRNDEILVWTAVEADGAIAPEPRPPVAGDFLPCQPGKQLCLAL